MYPAAEAKQILVLGACTCGARRRWSAADIQSRSLYGHYNGVPNECFGRFGTPAYCTNHISSWFHITHGTVQKVANALNGVAMTVDVTITIALCTLLAMGRTGFAECVPFRRLYRHSSIVVHYLARIKCFSD